jgi:hypothetical protein
VYILCISREQKKIQERFENWGNPVLWIEMTYFLDGAIGTVGVSRNFLNKEFYLIDKGLFCNRTTKA